MSTHLDWNQNYSVGIDQIDEQHHFFVGLINRLSDELPKAGNLEYQKALLRELTAYARFHFVSEENLMAKEEYPLLDEHKQHHLQLIDRLSARLALVQMSQTPEHIDDMLNFLIEWFKSHTNIEDRMFADYSRNRDRSRKA